MHTHMHMHGCPYIDRQTAKCSCSTGQLEFVLTLEQQTQGMGKGSMFDTSMIGPSNMYDTGIAFTCTSDWRNHGSCADDVSTIEVGTEFPERREKDCVGQDHTLCHNPSVDSKILP